jgi:dihydrofolate synthase/folylpolyglutamate synthase
MLSLEQRIFELNRSPISEVDSLLKQFELFGIKLGLETSDRLLADLGNPQLRVPIVHVAGSNGKGSVCAYLSSMLTAAGYRVGRYTSPHLIDWCERICINQQPIAPETLKQVLDQVLTAIQPQEPCPTQFEVITAAAWLYFAQQNVDIAVMEVGLGGRLDATNVCDRSLVSVIISISREHWQRLGSTLAEIAGEKAGILKSGCPAVIGQLPPEAKAVVDCRVAALNCPVVYPKAATLVEPGWAEFRGIRYPLALQGDIQLQNSAVAIAALQFLQAQGWRISDAAIVEGMANTRWAGRLQWVTWQGHKLLIDGAHNPASARVLRQFVDSLEHHRPVAWVMGMLSTKDHADVFLELLRRCDRAYLVPVPGHSSAAPEQLVNLANQSCCGLAHCETYPDTTTALMAAIQSPKPALTVLCGSLYLIGDFLKQHKLGL